MYLVEGTHRQDMLTGANLSQVSVADRPFLRSPFLRRSELKWQVACHHEPHEPPSAWVEAEVPGGAQLDWARARGWHNFHYADGWKRLANLEDLFWTYRTYLTDEHVASGEDERLHLVCEGVDYECDVLLDGAIIHHQVGLHQSFDIDLSAARSSIRQIEIRVYPAPKADTSDTWGEEWARTKRSQANRVTKPSVSYGDDFHPRVIPLGIWQKIYLDVRPRLHFVRAGMQYQLSEDLSQVTLSVSGELSYHCLEGVSVRWSLRDNAGKQVCGGSDKATASNWSFTGSFAGPKLWWPHDHGEPHLYTATAELVRSDGSILDVQRWPVGLRRIRLVMHEGAWDWPPTDRWPKTRSNPPMTIEVNNRRIFARGACCVPMNVFFGTVEAEDCNDLVQKAREAHFNMLRISGGCVAFKPAFYQACDRNGILVWQDFPLACNQHPDDEEYLRLLDAESRSLIMRLREHPSVALWCGGNELFEIHSGMTDQSLPLRLLNKNTFELDQARPFLASTPLMGVAHGPYEFSYTVDGIQVDALELIQKSRSTAYPEFGCPGIASREVLETIIPEDQLFPPRPGTAWEDHKGFFAFVEREETWLSLPVLAHYFGESNSIEQLVERGQLLQAECVKAIFEEARRQQPKCSIALMWCLNEPWPNAANLSLLSWPRVPKQAYWQAAAACRPVLASARVEKFLWRKGERFSAEIWLLSDRAEGVPAGEITARLTRPDGSSVVIGCWPFDSLAAQQNRCGPRFELVLRGCPGVFMLSLECATLPDSNSTYKFVLKDDQ